MIRKKRTVCLTLVTALLLGIVLSSYPQMAVEAQLEAEPIANEWNGQSLTAPFVRSNFDDLSPSGHSVATDCQDPNGDYPYTPYDWPDATALLELEQSRGESLVTIKVRKAKPNTYFTLWLRLQGRDVMGNDYGGNPLDGSPGVALAHTRDLPKLLESTSPNPGSDDEPNGFTTDAKGNATIKLDLDFPIINGAYPFQRFANFDPTDERFPAENPALYPVAIVGKEGPFTIRIVSHCVDGMGHGFGPAIREWWFLWKFE